MLVCDLDVRTAGAGDEPVGEEPGDRGLYGVPAQPVAPASLRARRLRRNSLLSWYKPPRRATAVRTRVPGGRIRSLTSTMIRRRIGRPARMSTTARNATPPNTCDA